MIENKSYGVAAVKHDGSCYRILLIKRNHTYAFVDFLYGKYKMHDHTQIKRLLNKMVREELRIINKMNYDDMWYHAWSVDPRTTKEFTAQNYKFYKQARNYFEKWNPDVLRLLLSTSTPIGQLWEIPKGKAIEGESPLATARREFSEETGININRFEIMSDIPEIISYRDGGSFYTIYYYIAAPKRGATISLRIDYLSKQIQEVMDIRWMSLRDIATLNDQHFEKTVRNIITSVKKHFKLFYRT